MSTYYEAIHAASTYVSDNVCDFCNDDKLIPNWFRFECRQYFNQHKIAADEYRLCFDCMKKIPEIIANLDRLVESIILKKYPEEYKND